MGPSGFTNLQDFCRELGDESHLKSDYSGGLGSQQQWSRSILSTGEIPVEVNEIAADECKIIL